MTTLLVNDKRRRVRVFERLSASLEEAHGTWKALFLQTTGYGDPKTMGYDQGFKFDETMRSDLRVVVKMTMPTTAIAVYQVLKNDYGHTCVVVGIDLSFTTPDEGYPRTIHLTRKLLLSRGRGWTMKANIGEERHGKYWNALVEAAKIDRRRIPPPWMVSDLVGQPISYARVQRLIRGFIVLANANFNLETAKRPLGCTRTPRKRTSMLAKRPRKTRHHRPPRDS